MVDSALIKVTVPLPLWTDHVNCFLLPGEDGWRIMDTGIYSEETMTVWQRAFLEHGIGAGDIRQILVTHNHMDHLGAAGALQEMTGSPVYISAPDRAAFLELWDQDAVRTASPHHYFGIPGPLKAHIEHKRIAQYFRWVFPCPRLEELHAGDLVQSGNDCYRAVTLPGHSDGHLCFYSELSGTLLGGDVFVAPNNLVMKALNPLTDFFQSLKMLQGMDIKKMIPSHGKPFSRVSLRLGLIEQYRQGQLARIKKELGAGKTVYELYSSFLGRGAIPEHFFGMGEFYFFLEHLLAAGELTKTTEHGAWRYQVAPGCR